MLVLAGELLCFVLFALLGLRSHEEGITLGGLVRAAVPFQAGWLVANAVLGRPSQPPRGVEELINGVLKPWAPAWVIGLALRTLVFGRDFSLPFAVIAFITNAVLLFAWRLAAAHLIKPSAKLDRQS